MIATGTMPATKSRPNATWSYLPSFNPDSPHVGTLRVHEQRGSRVVRCATSSYLIQPTPAIGFAGTAYLVVKDAYDGDLSTAKGRADAARVGEVYECHLHADGRHRCTCTAGATEHARVGSACLHVLGLRELEASGVLDDVAHPLDRAANTGEDASPAPGETADRDEPADDDWLTDPTYHSGHVWEDGYDPAQSLAAQKPQYEPFVPTMPRYPSKPASVTEQDMF